MKALVIGGSRNIGYFTAVRLLGEHTNGPSIVIFTASASQIEKGWNVIFLLRNPSVFDNDEVIKRHIEQGTASLVKGDALISDDVKRAWDETVRSDSQAVDLLVFTVGQPRFPCF
jgi:NAD(P)-dependent dehydrogenase (short-subunit alcohol dehydrogenase family)